MITVDFDSTVITRFGEQQGSVQGYNPNKRVRNSHHTLLAFVSQTRMVANAWLRPGNTAASSNCTAFMEETIKEALKEQSVGLVRVDSGFYTEEILKYLQCNHLPNHHNKETLNTLKSYCFALGAWTVNHSINRH